MLCQGKLVKDKPPLSLKKTSALHKSFQGSIFWTTVTSRPSEKWLMPHQSRTHQLAFRTGNKVSESLPTLLYSVPVSCISLLPVYSHVAYFFLIYCFVLSRFSIPSPKIMHFVMAFNIKCKSQMSSKQGSPTYPKEDQWLPILLNIFSHQEKRPHQPLLTLGWFSWGIRKALWRCNLYPRSLLSFCSPCYAKSSAIHRCEISTPEITLPSLLLFHKWLQLCRLWENASTGPTREVPNEGHTSKEAKFPNSFISLFLFSFNYLKQHIITELPVIWHLYVFMLQTCTYIYIHSFISQRHSHSNYSELNSEESFRWQILEIHS